MPVRALASRTQESTEEINSIIENLPSGAGEAVKAMSDSREQARKLSDRASDARITLDTIAASVAQINDMSTEIAVAAEEQSSVTGSMKTSISHIDDLGGDNQKAPKTPFGPASNWRGWHPS